MTRWAPETVRLALSVMPGADGLLISGSKTLREKLNIDVMKRLRDTAAALGVGASKTEQAHVEVLAMPPEVIGVRHVAVNIEAMQQVAEIEVKAAGETDGLKNALWIGDRRLLWVLVIARCSSVVKRWRMRP